MIRDLAFIDVLYLIAAMRWSRRLEGKLHVAR